MRRTSLLLVAVALAAALPCTAAAQFPSIPGPGHTPRIWYSAGFGIQDIQSLVDPEHNATWDFGTMFQGRGTVERTIQNNAAIGLVGSYARGPMTYRGPLCPACAADATVWQLMAKFRIGGGSGLHQVIEVGGGLTGFGGVQPRDAALQAPASSFTDGTIFIGYGFGYPMGQTMQFNLVQEIGVLFHDSGSGAGAASSNTIRTSVTRVGLRFTFGGGAPR